MPGWCWKALHKLWTSVAAASCHAQTVTLFLEGPSLAPHHPLPWLFYTLIDGNVKIWKISSTRRFPEPLQKDFPPRQPYPAVRLHLCGTEVRTNFAGKYREICQWVRWPWPRRQWQDLLSPADSDHTYLTQSRTAKWLLPVLKTCHFRNKLYGSFSCKPYMVSPCS